MRFRGKAGGLSHFALYNLERFENGSVVAAYFENLD